MMISNTKATRLFTAALLGLVGFVPAHAATLSNPVHFSGMSILGSEPEAGLIVDASGTFYGTTSQGGAGGNGTVFSLTKSGTFTSLASFDASGTSGANPYGSLIADASGTLYGTTRNGGASGRGTVFSLTKSGALTALASFNGSNGANPLGSLFADASGTLYGTTEYGGASNRGTVFSLTKSGSLTTLASFNVTNGAFPNDGLVADASGTLYGTTLSGGSNVRGTVFSLTSGGTLTTLANFNFNNAGAFPSGNLHIDASGTLYGTTVEGGAGGNGTVFSLTKSGTFTSLASFDASGTSGANPYGSLIADASGTLYGTTQNGGASGQGTVFSLTKSGALTALASFNFSNGAYPLGSLVADASGTLYGTTKFGGLGSRGTVFSLTDTGFDVGGTVPEPASWAMLITGFGLVGGMARRLRNGATVPA